MFTSNDGRPGSSKAEAERAYLVNQLLFSTHPRAPTKEDMATIGLHLWPHSYKLHPRSDAEAYEALIQWARDEEREMFLTSMHLPSEQIGILGAARWADQAFPRYVIPHTYAAALMATSITNDVIDDVRPPYKAFMIDVPVGLLSIWNDKTGAEAPLRWILVQYVETYDGKPVWQYVAHTDESLCIWRHGVTTRGLGEPDLPGNSWEGCSFLAPKDDRDDRVAALIGRLIVGVCLASMIPGNSKPTSKHSRTDPERMTESDIRTFRLGRALKLDFREPIREYISGKKSSVPSVRTLVRGHFKTQRHGPGNSLIKVIWREPYMRGPEEAPVLVRPIVVGADSR